MRKRTRRKIWATNIDPVAHAIAGAAITTNDILNKLSLTEYNALDAMTKGLGTVEHWKSIADCMNIAQCMGESGIGPEVLPHCEQVQKSLLKAAEHYEKTRRMTLDAAGIKAIREMLEYADLQRKSISRAEYERYINKTWEKIKSEVTHVYEIS